MPFEGEGWEQELEFEVDSPFPGLDPDEDYGFEPFEFEVEEFDDDYFG